MSTVRPSDGHVSLLQFVYGEVKDFGPVDEHCRESEHEEVAVEVAADGVEDLGEGDH